MKDEILKSLKTKYKNLGFGDKAFEGVANYLATTVTEADQVETATDGVKTLLTSFQGDIDKRVNDAVAKAKAPTSGDEQVTTPTTPAATTKEDDKNDQIAQLTTLVTGLAQSVNGLVQKDKTQTLQSKWNDLAKEKGIKNQTLINKWMPSSEDEFDTSIAELEDFNKSLVINESNDQSTGKPPVGAGGAAAASKKGLAALDSYLEKTKPVVEPTN